MEIVLHESGGSPAAAEPAHSSYVDGGNTRMIQRGSSEISCECAGDSVHDCRRKRMSVTEVREIGFCWGRRRERRAGRNGTLRYRHAIEIRVDAVEP